EMLGARPRRRPPPPPTGRRRRVRFLGVFSLSPRTGAPHQARRKLADGDERFRRFYEATPFFPFTGHGGLGNLASLLPAAAVGVAAACVGRYFHASLFGG